LLIIINIIGEVIALFREKNIFADFYKVQNFIWKDHIN